MPQESSIRIRNSSAGQEESDRESNGEDGKEAFIERPDMFKPMNQARYVHMRDRVLHTSLGGVDVVATLMLVLPQLHDFGGPYLGKMPTRSPIRPVHQSSAFSVRFRIVMISPFLKPRSPSWSASNVNNAIA